MDAAILDWSDVGPIHTIAGRELVGAARLGKIGHVTALTVLRIAESAP